LRNYAWPYAVKLRNAQRFLAQRDKVKVVLRFRGREMAHKHLGEAVIQRFAADLAAVAKVESLPRLDGPRLILVLAPR